jgi:RHS repeat-associated protein
VTKYIRTGVEILAAKKGSEKLFYHNDHLGGVNVITDIFGVKVQLVEYDPWGKVSRSEGSANLTKGFTGKELDLESGLYYYGGRYSDPDLGRFVSPDPFVSDPDPQNLNRYSYVINNPINYIDPSGYFHRHKSGGSFLGSFLGTMFGTLISIFTGIPAFEFFAATYSTTTAAVLSGAIAGSLGGAVSSGLSGGNPGFGFLFGGLSVPLWDL